jgi:hypothetical protein
VTEIVGAERGEMRPAVLRKDETGLLGTGEEMGGREDVGFPGTVPDEGSASAELPPNVNFNTGSADFIEGLLGKLAAKGALTGEGKREEEQVGN